MGKLRKACANCIKYKLACEAKRPCARCILHQCDCIDVERKPRTVKKKGIKRSKFDTVEKLHSMCFPPAQPLSHFPQIQDTPTNPPFIPELVTIDSFPIQDSILYIRASTTQVRYSQPMRMHPNSFDIYNTLAILSCKLRKLQ